MLTAASIKQRIGLLIWGAELARESVGWRRGRCGEGAFHAAKADASADNKEPWK